MATEHDSAKSLRYAGFRRWGRIAVGAALLFSAGESAQAGFLDALFGGPRAPAYYNQPSYGDFASPYSGGGYDAPRRRNVRRAPKPQMTTSQAAKVEALCCKTGGDPMKAIMQDETLIAGDVVMTPNGLRTFKGSRAPHSESDFVDITNSRYVSRSQRQQLLAMDR
ncbi:MAG: hypothetical protein JWM36_3944 [Hyphomicrobiales bacterium]|nr:hypothetical protein [Hyphomicrobiales bacterium]